VPSRWAHVISSVAFSDIPSAESCFLKVSTPLRVLAVTIGCTCCIGFSNKCFSFGINIVILDFYLKVEEPKDTKPGFARLVL